MKFLDPFPGSDVRLIPMGIGQLTTIIGPDRRAYAVPVSVSNSVMFTQNSFSRLEKSVKQRQLEPSAASTNVVSIDSGRGSASLLRAAAPMSDYGD